MWWLCSKIALRKGKIFFLHVSSCEWRGVRGEGTGAIWNIAQRLSSVWKVQGEVDEFCFLVIIHGQWSSFGTLEGLQPIISRRSINNHIEFIPLQSAILHSNWQGRFAFSKNRLYAYNESGAPENYRSIHYTESIDRRLNCSKSIDERWEVLLKLMKIPICNSKGMVYSDEFFSNKVKMISSNLWSSNPIWHVCHRDFGQWSARAVEGLFKHAVEIRKFDFGSALLCWVIHEVAISRERISFYLIIKGDYR